jgi:maltose alpha-D-glucosyltransferase / alpha-amylase
MSEQWYKNAIFYELHVKTFYDSSGDGIGDFQGLTQKLDYIRDLGVTCIWLLPFFPSPLRDDGYDIADYLDIHPDYGTLDDFRAFLDGAHARGLRVIADLVINHTSDQHPWFQAARSDPDSPYRDYYVWSETDEKYTDARIIFTDTEISNWTWDRNAGAYFWHRFFSHQPDLNFDNPAVHDAILAVMDHWLDMGLDGFRVDAVPYLYEREGTNCENLPETHTFLKKMRAHIDERFPGRVLLAEANQWPEDVIAYFGDDDEFHMAFNFPVMPRLFMGLQQQLAGPVIDIIHRTPDIPPNCQWCLFLRNHDELTLEMVTDEERDYMYREYAKDPRMKINVGIRRRLAPLLENDRNRIEMLNAILFSLPGSPVIYYGDEIAMGDNVYLGDRNGVRTPFQWSIDRNGGFSRADAAQLYAPIISDPVFGFMAVNVEAQQRSPSSLLNRMKLMIRVRQRHPVFGDGAIEFLYPGNPAILVYLRTNGGDAVLCINNMAQSAQPVELDLSAYAGCTPVDMFGETRFPPIGELPYFITLGPNAFFWFRLER